MLDGFPEHELSLLATFYGNLARAYERLEPDREGSAPQYKYERASNLQAEHRGRAEVMLAAIRAYHGKEAELATMRERAETAEEAHRSLVAKLRRRRLDHLLYTVGGE